MKKYIALLRGINVAGKNKLKMQVLRELLGQLGWTNIDTYIQSGNIVFEAAPTDTKSLAIRIKKALKDAFDYDIPTLVFEAEKWEKWIKNNPFLQKNKELDIKYLHLTFLSEIPTTAAVEKVKKEVTGSEQLQFWEDKIYLYYPDGYGKAKMTNNRLEQKLKRQATTRNWRTCLQILSLID